MENGILLIGGKHHGQVVESKLECVQMANADQTIEVYRKSRFVDVHGGFSEFTDCYVLDGLKDPFRQTVDLAKQAGELLDVLKMSASGLHKNEDNQPCLCSQCEFVRKRNELLDKIESNRTK